MYISKTKKAHREAVQEMVYDMHNRGYSYRFIGTCFGKSASWAHQIFDKLSTKKLDTDNQE